MLKAETSMESPSSLLVPIGARVKLIFITFTKCFNNLVINFKFWFSLSSTNWSSLKEKISNLLKFVSRYCILFNSFKRWVSIFDTYVNSQLILVKPRSCLWFFLKLIVTPANSIFGLESRFIFQIRFLRIFVLKIT